MLSGSKSLATTDKIVVTGVGKSGIAADFFAASLLAHGVLAAKLDPLAALHGDLGMLQPNDGLVLVSASGSTTELHTLLDAIFTSTDRERANLGVFGTDGGTLVPRCWQTVITSEGPKDDVVTNYVPSVSFVSASIALSVIAFEIAQLRGSTAAVREAVHPAGNLHQLRG